MSKLSRYVKSGVVGNRGIPNKRDCLFFARDTYGVYVASALNWSQAAPVARSDETVGDGPGYFDGGIFVGPQFPNLFIGGPTGAELVTLTAQKYCLQVWGGSVTCSYGTATEGSPLQFTASAGDVTFTPSGATKWMLSDAGGYVFPYIPPGATSAQTAATSGDNGLSAVMDTAMKSLFRGNPDGTELWPDSPTLSGVWTDNGDGSYTAITGTAGHLRTADGVVSSSSRYLARFTVTGHTTDWVVLYIGGTGTTISANDTYEIEVVAGPSNTYITFYKSATFDGTISEISVQKLDPAPATLCLVATMGAASSEITAPLNFLTVNDTAQGLLYADSGGTIKATDGTNTATLTIPSGWDRDDKLFLFLTISATQMYLSYALPTDSSPTDGTPVAYDGSFGPDTTLRVGLGVSAPWYWKGHSGHQNEQTDAVKMRTARLLNR